MKCYCEYILEEILQMIKDNLILLYNYKEDALINIREYCVQKNDEKYQPLDYHTLASFADEAIAELVNTDFLYDFRDIDD